MAGESYQRAYGAMVSVQLLAELEEVIQYKFMPERQPVLRKLWWDRLQVSSLCNILRPLSRCLCVYIFQIPLNLVS